MEHYGIGGGTIIENKYWLGKEYTTMFHPTDSQDPLIGKWNIFGDLPNESGEPTASNENDNEELSNFENCEQDPEHIQEQVDESDVSRRTIQQLFQCPEETCTAEFIRWKNLDRHLARGIHKSAPSQENLYDYAMDLYGKSLEGLCPIKYPEVMDEALGDLLNPEGGCTTQQMNEYY